MSSVKIRGHWTCMCTVHTRCICASAMKQNRISDEVQDFIVLTLLTPPPTITKNSMSTISHLLLIRVVPNFKGSSPGSSLTLDNCHKDICPDYV